MKQYVYSFKEGNKDMRVILGGKGANLAEMTSIGLPVPQGLLYQQKLVLLIMKMENKFRLKFVRKLIIN